MKNRIRHLLDTQSRYWLFLYLTILELIDAGIDAGISVIEYTLGVRLHIDLASFIDAVIVNSDTLIMI